MKSFLLVLISFLLAFSTPAATAQAYHGAYKEILGKPAGEDGQSPVTNTIEVGSFIAKGQLHYIKLLSVTDEDVQFTLISDELSKTIAYPLAPLKVGKTTAFRFISGLPMLNIRVISVDVQAGKATLEIKTITK